MGGVFAACESFLQRAGRNPEAGKLPATCRMESRSGKASCSVQDEIPKLENFLQRAGRNPETGKLPAVCRTKSRSGKASCSVQDGIPVRGRQPSFGLSRRLMLNSQPQYCWL